MLFFVGGVFIILIRRLRLGLLLLFIPVEKLQLGAVYDVVVKNEECKDTGVCFIRTYKYSNW